jgi:polysaccharide biosynthesis/export protein
MTLYCSTSSAQLLRRKPLAKVSLNTQCLNSLKLGRNQVGLVFAIWLGLLSPGIAQTSRQAPRPASPPQAGVNLPGALPANFNQAINPGEYLLGPGDRLRIDLFSVPEFSGEYSILQDGSINMPLIGALSLQGRTLQQASSTISGKYAPLLQRPIVTVGLLAARPIQVAISGEVNRPGSYTLGTTASNAGDNVASITRMLQLAEGVTQSADLRQVQIRRVAPVGRASNETITVDLWELVKTGNLRQDLRLRDGDSIFIPPTASIDLAEAQQLAATNFAARNNRPLKINVVGEVYRPGPYTLIEGSVSQRDQLINPNLLQVPSVTRAIQVAGGITQIADVRNIQVRRLTRTGPPQTIKLDFWKLLKQGDGLQDIPLQDGDTIEIPTAPSINNAEITELATASFSPDRINITIAGEVDRPGTLAVQPNTTMTQALLTAGGFNRKAKKGDVTLIRLNPNGSVTKRDVPIDFASGVSDERNPALRNNDIIIVKKTGFASFLDNAGAFLGPFSGISNFFRLLP